MKVRLRWIRLVLSFCFFCLCMLCLLYHTTALYLIGQACGQLSVLRHTKTFAEFEAENKLSEREKRNLLLIEDVKRYSVDSLGYLPTQNFTRIYDQKNSTTLWVITACEPYSFRAYEWIFPVVGKVSYKGFFKKELAEKEANHLVTLGYDVDVRSVTAWSTLGWFKDPVLSSMLGRSRAGICNLLFHELFHATYYAPNSVDLNENLANFIADKATLRFLAHDTAELRHFNESNADELTFTNYMLRKKKFLQQYYAGIAHKPERQLLKLRALVQIADSVNKLPLNHKARYQRRTEDILRCKNAYFVDFEQYESKQDSLEKVFNKFYRGDLKYLVSDIRRNKINY